MNQAAAAKPALPDPLSLVALTVAGLLCLPLAYVTSTALTADAAVWSRLWTTRIPELLFNTTALALGVAAGTLLLGVSLAWLVSRREFPGRRIWEWALVLPLAVPTYVLAYIYSHLLGAGGPAEMAWQALAGPDSHLPSPYSYAGVTLVMTLDTFPFVYLLARAAFLNLNVSYEEVARACGVSRTGTLFRITLPLMRPAIVASAPRSVTRVASAGRLPWSSVTGAGLAIR